MSGLIESLCEEELSHLQLVLEMVTKVYLFKGVVSSPDAGDVVSYSPSGGFFGFGCG